MHHHQYPSDEARVGSGDPLVAWSQGSDDFFKNYLIVEENYSDNDWFAFFSEAVAA